MKKILFLITLLSSFLYSLELNNVSADFEQTILNKNNKITYKGKLYFKNNKNLWEYTTPTQKKVFLNENLITIVDDELEQVIFEQLKDEINISNILKTAKNTQNNTYETIYDNVIYTIHITDDNNIQITYTDNEKNKISLNLTNVMKNQNLNDKIFQPSYPEEYDIVQ